MIGLKHPARRSKTRMVPPITLSGPFAAPPRRDAKQSSVEARTNKIHDAAICLGYARQALPATDTMPEVNHTCLQPRELAQRKNDEVTSDAKSKAII